MPESLQTQVAVLTVQLGNLTEAIHAERDENRKFREDTSKKLAQMKTTLDMAKGGWAVMAALGAIFTAIIGVTTNVFKMFHA